MDHPEQAWRDLQAVRATSPLVHNITNYVAMDISANVLLAAGASPAMILLYLPGTYSGGTYSRISSPSYSAFLPPPTPFLPPLTLSTWYLLWYLLPMDHPEQAWRDLQAVRATSPLVHNITNYVAMDISANVLLAAGASPAMIHAIEEAAEFTALSAALTINIGTISTPWANAMEAAMSRAKDSGIPMVLDPVGAGATEYRTQFARKLLAYGPTVIRGNASEILALAGATGVGATKGVDSSHRTDETAEAALHLAQQCGSVVAVTGAVDRITDGRSTHLVRNGHPLMSRVTALGCALSALIGAFLTIQKQPLLAATHGLALFGLAGELAAAESAGPGSLRWRILDQLYSLDARTVHQGLRIG